MQSFQAVTKVTIYGTRNSWSLESEDVHAPRSEVTVNLEIQGSAKNGFHLMVSPYGFFTADLLYQTLDEAFADGLELFGVPRNDWSESKTRNC